MNLKHTILLLTAFAVIFALTGDASAQGLWDSGGADNNWTTVANWDDDMLPVNTSINLGDGGTPTAPTVTTVNSAIANQQRMFTAGSNFRRAEFNMEAGGSLNLNRSGGNIASTLARGTNTIGTINQTGGTLEFGHRLMVASGQTTASGAVNLSGGLLRIYRGGNAALSTSSTSLDLGVNSPTKAEFNVSGTGEFETRVGVAVGDKGLFSVTGSAASVSIGGHGGNGDGFWHQLSGSTLAMAIGTDDMIAEISVNEHDGGTDHFATFASGSELDMSFAGTPSPGTWDLLKLVNGDISDGGLRLSSGTTAATGATAGWYYNVNNNGSDGILTATYGVKPLFEDGVSTAGAPSVADFFSANGTNASLLAANNNSTYQHGVTLFVPTDAALAAFGGTLNVDDLLVADDGVSTGGSDSGSLGWSEVDLMNMVPNLGDSTNLTAFSNSPFELRQGSLFYGDAEIIFRNAQQTQNGWTHIIDAVPVPEPATLPMLIASLLTFAFLRRRQ